MRSHKSTFNVGLVSVKYSLYWYFLWSRFFLAPHLVLMFACRYTLLYCLIWGSWKGSYMLELPVSGKTPR